MHVLWWRDHGVSLRASKLITTEDWLHLTDDEFDIFVDTIASNMARTAVKMDPDGVSTVTDKQRHWYINATNDRIKYLVESNHTVPLDGMEARELYKSEYQYFYNVLQNCVKGGQCLIYIRKYELTLDG
eukprot:14907705-Ditylum_brightwellii.AAC.1